MTEPYENYIWPVVTNYVEEIQPDYQYEIDYTTEVDLRVGMYIYCTSDSKRKQDAHRLWMHGVMTIPSYRNLLKIMFIDGTDIDKIRDELKFLRKDTIYGYKSDQE